MKARVIVDGYNVLKSTPQFATLERSSLEAARAALINWLSAKAHQYDIVVVFDAWEAGLSTERVVRERGVRVIYTRQGERADEVIIRLAGSAEGECIVVSRDSAVRIEAQAKGCQVAAPEALFAPTRRRGQRSARAADVGEEQLTRHEGKKKGPARRPKKRRCPPGWRF